MNKEIKEILNIFTKYKDDWYSVEYKLKPKQCVILYDYITNLQKENEDLKADYGSKAQVERDILQDRIDKEEITLKEMVKMINNELLYQRNIYRSRVERTLDYIHHQIFVGKSIGIKKTSFDYKELKEILNILEGKNE